MYQLRDYQLEAVEMAVKHLTKKKPTPFVIQAATGAGKSLIIAETCHRLNEHILILQPSKEILEQNYQKLLSYDPLIDAGIYSASKGRKEIAKFTFATIGSIYKKPAQFKHFKYVIIDECHGVNPKNLEGMLTSFLAAIQCSAVCGLTATPYRIDQKFYTDDWGDRFYTAHLKMINRIHPFFFKQIVYRVETQDLIERKYLCPIEYFCDKVDITGLEANSTGADFTKESLEKFWNDRKLRRIAQAIEYGDNHHKKTLTFCSSLRQARNAMALALDMGFSCEMVTGETPLREREAIIERFKNGQTKHLLNMGVFTTGFDMPDLDCIILARPTMSLALYYQMIGRGVRIDPANPNKTLTVYDMCGMVERLGRVESIRVHREKGGFRDEVWSEGGRMDEQPLFKWLVKKPIGGK